MTYFGFLNCDKPAGMTSRDVVNVVQRRLRKDKIKVGHAGTLDPLAEGVLVLGVGPAVRLVPYVQQQPKHYRAMFLLGQSTVSGDLEDEPSQHPELPIPSRAQLDEATAGLVGSIEQTPPAHSAIWVDGKRAYERIRAGEQVAMPRRRVEVHSLQILRYEFPQLELDIVCGSGTYIRTLGLDLALACGSIAVMAHLRRVAVGRFVQTDAIPSERLRDDDLEAMLMPATMGVSHLPRIIVDETGSTRLGHGLCVEGQPLPCEGGQTAGDEIAALTSDGQLRAIVRQRASLWCPHRVFPLAAE